MADDNNIVISIVLDDGSIVKGFAKVEKAAEDSGKKISGFFSGISSKDDLFDVLKDKAISLLPEIAGIGLAVIALKKAFDFSIEGEKVNALESQFQLLATREGLAADVLKEGLEKSANGLIDTTDLLKEANGAIAVLGANASKLPQILDISTKSAALFGGTAKEKFDDITHAIETGNQKQLKNAGIVLDTDRVYKEFAKTIGITAGELSQAEKQTALLNATLEKGGNVFQGVTNDINPIQNALQRVKVSTTEFFESIEIIANKNFGGTFKSALDEVNKFIRNITPEKAIDSIDSVSAHIEKLKQKQIELNKELAEANMFTGTGGIQAELGGINKKIEEQTQLLNNLKAADANTTAAQIQNLKDRNENEAKLDNERAINATARNATLQQNLLANQNAVIASQQQTLSAELSVQAEGDQAKITRATLAQETLVNTARETSLKIAQVDKQFNDESGFDDEQREQIKLGIANAGAAKLIELKKKTIATEKALEQQKLATYSGVAGQIATLMNSDSRELFEIGKAAAITQATIDGYLAVSKTFATIPPPFNFAAAALVGIAAAANVAKIASTQFGQGASGGTGFSAAGGGVAAGGGGLTTPSTPLTQNVAAAETKPGTAIEVNIEGSVLDSDATGLRIVDLLNSAFDKQGVTVTT